VNGWDEHSGEEDQVDGRGRQWSGSSATRKAVKNGLWWSRRAVNQIQYGGGGRVLVYENREDLGEAANGGIYVR
jgi:hypothetical protein